ncbi:acylneuraminate cytidylyltransferase family protein [Aquabacterium sp. A7-Y]|uniref:acylneuraminate cytidylyltransferase family protein n=1 Tax=Aquabacterium sp. A7-Y TaxID=1349605 RepID=UPI00223E3316|nr:acylneuraminate cytidylyltransferase family protein [Aquabacterium sp. A7-Y]MCW7536791.1 acylneuraminate cytidylyltransferase family protein [Aquabacterium sp. A7-Y]
MRLALIPARGGSKGIPRKNIRLIAGKPLIAWTIEAALSSKLIDRCVVSTEDAEIAEVAKQFGAEVLTRPAELATDVASTDDVMQHALAAFPETSIIVLLQCTSPIRDRDLIDRAVQRFIDTDADSLATGFTCKYKEYGTKSTRRQDYAGFFYDDGNIYINKADLVRAGDRFGQRLERMEIDREQNIDIDEPFDFWLAEKILEKRANA